MKVLMLSERYLPIWGGAENQLHQLAPRLQEAGWQVEILTRRWRPEMARREIMDGVPIRRLAVPGKGTLATAAFGLSLLAYLLRRANRTTIVHSHGAAALGALAKTAALMTHSPTVAKVNTAGRIPRLAASRSGRILLALFKRCDGIVCMSDEIQAELEAIHTGPQRILRIENGVDTLRFAPAPAARRQAWRRQRGIPEAAVIAVFSGRLVRRKGCDLLLAAWAQVYAEVPQAHLFILGTGENQPDSVEAELREKVRSASLPRVHLEGYVPAPEDYLGVADIFVLPSRLEGFPNALLEAMAAGAAPVVSRIGGNADLIGQGRNGLLVPKDDSGALAAALRQLVLDADLRRTLGAAARRDVAARDAFGVIETCYLDLYRRLTA